MSEFDRASGELSPEREMKVELTSLFATIHKDWRESIGCFSDESLTEYAEGRGGLIRRLRFWLHVRRCGFCREELGEACESIRSLMPQAPIYRSRRNWPVVAIVQ